MRSGGQVPVSSGAARRCTLMCRRVRSVRPAMAQSDADMTGGVYYAPNGHRLARPFPCFRQGTTVLNRRAGGRTLEVP